MIVPSVKTTKRKKRKSNRDHLWKQFDNEILSNHTNQLECLYSKQYVETREKCDLCQSAVAYDDEHFLTCTNTKCGVIYKDQLDSTAEWRYYGADDNQMSDPTRCGMPINPLLKESSYGCKVICMGNSTYEMRKITTLYRMAVNAI